MSLRIATFLMVLPGLGVANLVKGHLWDAPPRVSGVGKLWVEFEALVVDREGQPWPGRISVDLETSGEGWSSSRGLGSGTPNGRGRLEWGTYVSPIAVRRHFQDMAASGRSIGDKPLIDGGYLDPHYGARGVVSEIEVSEDSFRRHLCVQCRIEMEPVPYYGTLEVLARGSAPFDLEVQDIREDDGDLFGRRGWSGSLKPAFPGKDAVYRIHRWSEAERSRVRLTSAWGMVLAEGELSRGGRLALELAREVEIEIDVDLAALPRARRIILREGSAEQGATVGSVMTHEDFVARTDFEWSAPATRNRGKSSVRLWRTDRERSFGDPITVEVWSSEVGEGTEWTRTLLAVQTVPDTLERRVITIP